MTIPNVFWKYYDLYRRKQISLEEFVSLSQLTKSEIQAFLKKLATEQKKR